MSMSPEHLQFLMVLLAKRKEPELGVMQSPFLWYQFTGSRRTRKTSLHPTSMALRSCAEPRKTRGIFYNMIKEGLEQASM
jgi:hypothetical protein